jgi:hypothetical protein
MFTTGSKFFFGASAIAAAAAVVYATSSGDPLFTGTIVLVGLAVVAGFLGGLVSAFRDATRPAAAGAEAIAPAHRAAPYSVWPILVAFAAGVTALGIAVDRRALLLGVVALLVLGVEWVVQSWTDGASNDPSYNGWVRGKFMHAIEFPVLGAVGVGFVGFLFSRLMLTLHETAAVVAFIGLGALILVGATILANSPGASRKLLPLFLVVGGVGLVAAGVVGIARGEADHAELHEKLPNIVAAKSNPEAVVHLGEGGALEPAQLIVPKGTFTNLIFRNDDPGERKLVVQGKRAETVGTKTETVLFEEETEYIEEGKVAFLAIRFGKSGTFEYWVADHEGHKVATGKVVVP